MNQPVVHQRRVVRGLSIVMACLWLSGCGSGYSGGYYQGGAPVTTSFLRIVNTLPNSPTLLVGVDNANLARVSFAQATGMQQTISGAYSLNVQYIDAAGTNVAVITPQALTLVADEQTTAFVVGTLGAARTKLVVHGVPNIAAGSAQVQVVQTAAAAGTLDVYLTDAAADLASATKLTTVAFEQASDLATVASGANYRLRVTAPGSTNVLYDSGTFSIADTARLMFVVVDYFGPGGAGFRVIAMNNQVATTFPQEVLPGAFRIANMIADVPLVDLYLGPVAGAPVFAGVAFGSVAALEQFTAGTLNYTLTSAGSTTVLASGSVALSPGDTRTLVAVRNGASVAARATVDSTRPISGRGQLQIVNAAPSAGSLNCYLLKAGEAVGSTTAAALDQPPLTFATAAAAAGAVDIVFTPPAAATPAAGPEPLVVADGGIYTVYAADAAGGGAPHQIVVDDN